MLKSNRADADVNAEQEATARPVSAGGTARFQLKPSKQTCIALGGIMGLLLLSSVGLYAWQSGEIATLDGEVAAKQTQLDNSEKVARDLEQVRQASTSTRNELRFLETSVTEGQYVPTLLKQTEDLAKSTNLKVASVRPTLEPAPKPPTDKELLKKFKPQPYDKLHIDFEVSGKYWDVARTLYRLTEFPKILAVDSMQVTPKTPQVGVSPNLSVKMKLTGFIFPNDGLTHGAVPALPGAGTAAPTVAPAVVAPAPKSAAAVSPVVPARKA